MTATLTNGRPIPADPDTRDERSRKGLYDHVRCSCCGHPWSDHPADCPRHPFRPGAASGGV